MSGRTAYTVFWLYRAYRDWRTRPEPERCRARQEFVELLEARGRDVTLRGAYSTVGLCAGVDLILWLVSPDLDALQSLAAALNRTELGAALELRHAYFGLAAASQYDPEHGPAFLKGTPPSKYLSVYPFTKTPEWYLLSYEERRDLMKVHGDLGREFPTILTNTVSSFGIADQEFIVALEDDDPATLVAMVQRLRAADVRLYTKVDTPIFLGRLEDPASALADLG
ncbi:MAG TPA: chlorite dismutase family protein [Thermomicrobiaceae bacterium]|nr:chlorite dismutase family protein [Thermomicrobiaceae bacterium]